MAALPDIKKLWDAYPKESDIIDACKGIGGAVGRGVGERGPDGSPTGWIQNSCAIKLSRAFNYADPKHRIPNGYKFAIKKTPLKLNTIVGGDKYRYAFRVAEMLKYLAEKYGRPAVRVRKKRGDDAVPASFAGKSGVIVFNDCGWGNATGHIDLWNGTDCRGAAYWSDAKEVYLWSSAAAFTVTAARNGQLLDGDTPIITLRFG